MSASDWIKMTHGLRSRPEVVQISSALKADRLRTIGALYVLWTIVDMNTADGLLPGYTFSLVDEDIGWPGFAAAVASVGWLEENAQGVVIPNFERHNGKCAKRRAQEAARGKSRRDAGKRPDLIRNESGRDSDASSLLSSSLVLSDSSGSEGESEGKPETRPNYDCWDGVKRSHIFRAYPELGRKQPAPAQDAIGNAAEWIVENRPDLGDPLAFLMDRVKAYAKSPEGTGRYVPNAAKWFQDRRFMEGERSWQRGDDKRPKKAKTYSELEAERNANGTATQTH